MKKFALIICLAIVSISISAQNKRILLPPNDSILNDTSNFYSNMMGLNVFPAFGLLGGGIMPSTKIYIQYKYMFKRANLKFNLNYINYHKQNDRLDIILPDQSIATDTVKLRKFYDEIFSYDARLGAEWVFPRKDVRFYIGASGIVGMHNYSRNYYSFNRVIDSDLLNSHQIVADSIIPPTDINREGYSDTRMLKLGFDISLGVDFNIAENCVLSIQYTPEFAYYKKIGETLNDPEFVFTKPIDNGWVFAPDYIDVIIYINF
jgi:hypothetical protein